MWSCRSDSTQIWMDRDTGSALSTPTDTQVLLACVRSGWQDVLGVEMWKRMGKRRNNMRAECVKIQKRIGEWRNDVCGVYRCGKG